MYFDNILFLISVCSGSSFPCAGLARTGCYWSEADALDKGRDNLPLSYEDIVTGSPKKV